MATDTCSGEDLRSKPAHIKEGIETSEIAHGVTEDDEIQRPLAKQIVFHNSARVEGYGRRACPQGTRACNGSWRDIQRYHVVCQTDQVLGEGPRTTAQLEDMSIATSSEQRHEPGIPRLLEGRTVKF